MRLIGAAMQHQSDLFALFPGAAGGRALVDQFGPDYLASIGAAGGASTLARYGRLYFAALGERGRREARRRRDELPRTIKRPDGSRIRVIPWRPHKGSEFYSPRRRRPVVVVVELGAGNE